MFGILHTGDSYTSQTEHLVSSTRTYLRLCYLNAFAIHKLSAEEPGLISCLKKNNKTAFIPGLGMIKNNASMEEMAGEAYRELVIHSETAKLYAAFSLESFINSFATFLANQKILINVQDEARETILHYIGRLFDRMSTLDKWEEVAVQYGRTHFNRQTVLWKRFCDLYRFRDNAVHDKPLFFRRTGDILQIKKGVLKPVQQLPKLESPAAHYLNEAYQACKTHDDMVGKLLMITGVKEEQEACFVIPNHYHRKIKTLIKKVQALEEISEESD